jgi:NAD(P)-dependent dehydrogenase (short-subunit alcohol dehydrogenase family)
MNLRLESKTAFISGSTQGIGFAIAKLLLAEGASVVINGRSQQKLDAALERLRTEVPGASVSGITADFGDASQVNNLLAGLIDIDILINNVGIFELCDFTDISDEDWTRFFDVNVMSGVRLSRHLLPKMLAKNWGRIIFISSESAIDIPANMIHYGTSKTSMLSVSSGLAKLTKNTEVTVNTILGGPTIAQLAIKQNQSVEQTKKNLMVALNPTSLLQRFIEPDEIANLAVYISSPLSIATNGSALRADGGILNSIV